jgi:hypothetical protein
MPVFQSPSESGHMPAGGQVHIGPGDSVLVKSRAKQAARKRSAKRNPALRSSKSNAPPPRAAVVYPLVCANHRHHISSLSRSACRRLWRRSITSRRASPWAADVDEDAKVGQAPRPAAGPLAGPPEASSAGAAQSERQPTFTCPHRFVRNSSRDSFGNHLSHRR